MQITTRNRGDRKSRSLTEEILSIPALLPMAFFLFTGCQSPNAAAPSPPAEVEVAPVLQKDVPIYGEWVATLDGYVNAQIQPQVTGYIIKQSYKEGSFVRKGQILFPDRSASFRSGARSSQSATGASSGNSARLSSTSTATRL